MPETAIQNAMKLFWESGFNSTSTRQIETKTGITRFTLQKTYGGKKQLFLEALDLYLDIFKNNNSLNLTNANLDTIITWFEARSEPNHVFETSCFGCLLLNSAVEFGGKDAHINKRVNRFYTQLRSGFYNTLNTAQQNGNMADNIDINAMSEILLSAAIGQNIIIRSANNNKAGKKTANSIRSLINSWQSKPIINTK